MTSNGKGDRVWICAKERNALVFVLSYVHSCFGWRRKESRKRDSCGCCIIGSLVVSGEGLVEQR